MDDPLDTLSGLIDPAERAVRASTLIDYHQTVIGELSALRREAMNDMVTAGMTHAQIAAVMGMSRARVGQLLAIRTRAVIDASTTADGVATD